MATELVRLGIEIAVLLLALGTGWGLLKSELTSHSREIAQVRDEVKRISNGFSSEFVRKETLDARFDEINRRFDSIQGTLGELRLDVRRSGCEYPSCMFGQMLNSSGSIESVLEAIRKKREREEG